jgi:hypothetical protein
VNADEIASTSVFLASHSGCPVREVAALCLRRWFVRSNGKHALLMSVKAKVKLSLYRPWRPLGLREVEAPTLSEIRLTDGGKVVALRAGRSLSPGSWYSFLPEAESTPGI